MKQILMTMIRFHGLLLSCFFIFSTLHDINVICVKTRSVEGEVNTHQRPSR